MYDGANEILKRVYILPNSDVIFCDDLKSV